VRPPDDGGPKLGRCRGSAVDPLGQDRATRACGRRSNLPDLVLTEHSITLPRLLGIRVHRHHRSARDVHGWSLRKNAGWESGYLLYGGYRLCGFHRRMKRGAQQWEQSRHDGVPNGVPKLPNEVTSEAEMNLTCPVHGVRRLGAIHYLTFESDPDAAKLTQLVEAYELPLSQHLKAGVEPEHDPKES
jgi:hypothetical protein